MRLQDRKMRLRDSPDSTKSLFVDNFIFHISPKLSSNPHNFGMPTIYIDSNQNVEISEMPIARQFYFYDLHAYDLVATLRDFHRRYNEDGEMTAEAYRMTMRNLEEMRYGVSIVDNSNVWPHPYRTRMQYHEHIQEWVEVPVLLPTHEWFDAYGVHAAVPQIDINDVSMAGFIRDRTFQGPRGENNRVIYEILDNENSTAETVPTTDEEVENSQEHEDHWDNLIANMRMD